MNSMKTRKAATLGLALLSLAGLPAVLNAAQTNTAQTTAVRSVDDTQDAKAIEILDQWIEAIGGSEKIRETKFQTTKATLSMPAAGISGTIETYLQAPDKMLVISKIPMIGETRQGMNGNVVWSSDPMSGPRLRPEAEAKTFINEANPAYSLEFRKENPVIEYQGEVEFDGKQAHKIRLVNKDGLESTQYFDPESHLLRGTVAITPTPMGQVEVTTFMREYIETNGMMEPSKVVQRMGPQEFSVTIDSISYDEIDTSMFDLPEAIKALVEASKEED